MKKVLLLFVSLFLILCFSCSRVKHCDLRFCHFTVKTLPNNGGDTLWYTPAYTVHHPLGHVLPRATLTWVQEHYPEADVEYNVNGASEWTRVPDCFYVIPQTILTNTHPDKLPELLSCDSMWDDYKYTYKEFMNLTFDKHVPGVDPLETIYYCVFSGHKAKN